MTQNEILELAKSINEDWWLDDIDLKDFAKLVAEREREECAKVCWWLAGEFDVDSKTAIRCTEAIRARE